MILEYKEMPLIQPLPIPTKGRGIFTAIWVWLTNSRKWMIAADWHFTINGEEFVIPRGFQFDGARCLHFNLKNETDITRVSLNFRIAITRAQDCHDIDFDPDDQLCCPELLEDKFSQIPNFYDEVEVKIGDTQRSFPGPVATKYRSKNSISVVG